MPDFRDYKQTEGTETLIDVERIEYITRGAENSSIFYMKSGARLTIKIPFERVREILLNKKPLMETIKTKK